MNDKDKEAFDGWWNRAAYSGSPYKWDKDSFIYFELLNTWQAACDYKHKELEQKLQDYESDWIKMRDIAEEMQAENAKLRECLKFTVYAAEYLFKPDEKLADGLFPTSYFTLSYEGDLDLIEKTKYARQVLKELEDK